MNFKPWLESTEEQYSNEMTEKLCSWIKLHGRKPKVGPPPILAGSPTAGSRVSYNIDLEEHKLGEFLKDKIRSGQVYQSDQAILQRHGMEGLFKVRKGNRREISLKNVEKLAEFYKKNRRYPSRTIDKSYPELVYLARWLEQKRQKRRWYDGEKEFGISLGLPEDWIDHINNEQRNRTNIQKLAEYYKSKGSYPKETDPDPEVRYLKSWLSWVREKRRASYDGEKEFGISLGLPEDWMDNNWMDNNEQRNRTNIQKLAEYYKSKGSYPKETDPDPEVRYLNNWLRRKRQARRSLEMRRLYGRLYDGEKEFGISLGLPEDWLEFFRTAEEASKSELYLQKLAEYYKKNGYYPRQRDPDPEIKFLSHWLSRKRRAAKRIKGRVYEEEKELGISLGLPEDWLDNQKSKSS